MACRWFSLGLLIARVEFVNRRAEVMEAKLEKRIQRIEDEMQGKVHSMRCYRQSGTLRNEAQEILQTWVSLKQLFLNTQEAAKALKITSLNRDTQQQNAF